MRKGKADYLKLGDWNAICDVCGFKYKASELRLRWDGMRVCPEDFEHRHPQDFLKAKRDDQSVPWTRNPQDVFIELPVQETGRWVPILRSDLWTIVGSSESVWVGDDIRMGVDWGWIYYGSTVDIAASGTWNAGLAPTKMRLTWNDNGYPWLKITNIAITDDQDSLILSLEDLVDGYPSGTEIDVPALSAGATKIKKFMFGAESGEVVPGPMLTELEVFISTDWPAP